MNFSPAWRRHFRALRQTRKRSSCFFCSCRPPRTRKQWAAHPSTRVFPPCRPCLPERLPKVASLIAIVVGGYQFAHGEPGAKKALAGVAAGTGIAVLATNVLTWLWGI